MIIYEVEYFSVLRRIMHWALVLAVIGDIVSGIGLSFGIGGIPIRYFRILHGLSSWTLISLIIVYTYVFIVTSWWKDIIPTRKDFKTIPAFFKYVFYLHKDFTHAGRYNPGQKITYSSWYLLFIMMALTGIGLFFEQELMVMDKIFGSGLQYLRYLHFWGTVYLLVTLIIHVYLAIVEDPAKLAAIFCGVVRRIQNN